MTFVIEAVGIIILLSVAVMFTAVTIGLCILIYHAIFYS